MSALSLLFILRGDVILIALVKRLPTALNKDFQTRASLEAVAVRSARNSKPT